MYSLLAHIHSPEIQFYYQLNHSISIIYVFVDRQTLRIYIEFQNSHKTFYLIFFEGGKNKTFPFMAIEINFPFFQYVGTTTFEIVIHFEKMNDFYEYEYILSEEIQSEGHEKY